MKHFYLIAILILSAFVSSASPITLVTNNGIWKASSSWDKNRKPQNGDTILIPAGKTVIVNDQQSLNNVYIKVIGTLRFTNVLSYLNLNSASGLIVQTGGKIEATIDLWQYIIVGGNTIFYANEIVGPQQSTASGFASFNPLPVKFVGFTATRKNSNEVMVQWSTSEEMNADHYEIERSYDGANWTNIASINAAGNSATLNNYSYTDKNSVTRTVYYRIKQLDLDGKSTYTTISTIKSEVKGGDVHIASVEKKVLLQFPQQVKGNLVVRFVSFSGQVVDQQTITNPIGQVVLNSKVSGNYLISISNGQDLNVAKQVML